MATKLYPRSVSTAASSAFQNPSLGDFPSYGGISYPYGLEATAGASVAAYGRNTVASGTILCNGGYLSLPLAAGVTISSTITWNIWAEESNMSANVGVGGALYRVPADGSAPVLISQSARGVECAVGTSRSVNNWTSTPTSTTMSKGDRLLLVPYFANVGTMASGYSATMGINGATAAADGDTWVQLTENLTFATTPAGSTLYLTDTDPAAVDGTTLGIADNQMWTSRGASATSLSGSTVAGPVAWIGNPLQDAGGNDYIWYSKPLTAFTLDGVVRVHLRLSESNAAANVSARVELSIMNSAGQFSQSAVGSGWLYFGSASSELSTAETAPAAAILIPVNNISVANGQMIGLRVFLDDVVMGTAANQASGYSVSIWFNGPTPGGSGDSYITLPQTVTEYVAGTPVGSERQYIWKMRAPVSKTVQAIWKMRAIAGKSVQALWKVRAFVGKSVQAVYGVKTFTGKSVQAIWKVRAPVGKSVQSIWNVLQLATAVGKEVVLQWKVRAAVGAQRQAVWKVAALATKSVQAIWKVRAAVGAQRQAIWKMRAIAGAQRQAIWKVRAAVGAQRQMIWKVRALASKTVQAVFHVRAATGKSLQAVFGVKTSTSKTLQTVWKVGAIVGKSVQAVYHVRAAAGKSVQSIWNVLQLGNTAVGKDLQVLWKLASNVGKSADLRWGVRTFVGKSVALSWNVRAAVFSTRQAVFNVKTSAGKSLQSVWRVRTFVGKSVQAIWRVRTFVGKSVQAVWRVRAAAGDVLVVIWNIRASAAKTLQAVFNVRTFVGKSTQVVWKVREAIIVTKYLLWRVAGPFSDPNDANPESRVGRRGRARVDEK